MIIKYSLKNCAEEKISEHFKVKEFACKDGSDAVKIDEELVQVLEKVRKSVGKPVHIVSGYRTESYNTQCGGAVSSYHLQGMASDIRVDGVEQWKLAIIGAQCGAKGVGVYSDFVHLDTRQTSYIWRQ